EADKGDDGGEQEDGQADQEAERITPGQDPEGPDGENGTAQQGDVPRSDAHSPPPAREAWRRRRAASRSSRRRRIFSSLSRRARARSWCSASSALVRPMTTATTTAATPRTTRRPAVTGAWWWRTLLNPSLNPDPNQPPREASTAPSRTTTASAARASPQTHRPSG